MSLMLPWDYAAGIAFASGVAGISLLRSEGIRTRAIGAFLREGALVVGLYALWQLAGHLSITGTSGAVARAEWIEQVQRNLHLPSEVAMQHLILWSPLFAQAANIYYAVVHFSATIAFLIWLFVRHRSQYGQARTVLALTTFVCLAIQLIPVAPPRLLPGIVDTAVLYGQSVYGSGFGADELSAMPSMHVAWALAVGWYVWRIADSRWRWIGPTHAVLTIFVVVVTGNHWWLDTFAAAAVLMGSMWLVTGKHDWRRRVRSVRILEETAGDARLATGRQG
ncbi:MAG: phosphatase PAP2 family protein [Nakamurella sp.]